MENIRRGFPLRICGPPATDGHRIKKYTPLYPIRLRRTKGRIKGIYYKLLKRRRFYEKDFCIGIISIIGIRTYSCWLSVKKSSTARDRATTNGYPEGDYTEGC